MNIKREYYKIIKYINNKLLSGDYEFMSCDEYVAIVSIDNEYNFSIWIANGPDLCGLYNISSSFLGEIPDLLSEEEHVKLYNSIMPKVKAYRSNILVI